MASRLWSCWRCRSKAASNVLMRAALLDMARAAYLLAHNAPMFYIWSIDWKEHLGRDAVSSAEHLKRFFGTRFPG